MKMCTAALGVFVLVLVSALPAHCYVLHHDYSAEADEDALLRGRGTAKPGLLLELLQLLHDVARSKGRLDDVTRMPNSFPDMASAVSGPEVAKRNDFGVLPPWNEFCRMMRITHCVAAK